MTTCWIDHDGGRLAYSDQGSGPLVVCVPGIGDLRQEYRFLAPRLVDAGCRVVAMDLRGHGESSTGWRDVSPEAVGSDVLALVEHLDAGPAIVIGNSKAASAAVWAASESPGAVVATVLIGPFVRDSGSWARRHLLPPLFRVMFAGPWGVGAWMRFWATLFPSARPADFDAYAAALRANLAEPGRLAALRGMMAHGPLAGVDARLARVRVPSLVVMGGADPDFPDPAAEAAALADALGARVLVVDGAGHYPHVERPEVTNAAIVDFTRSAVGERHVVA